MYAVLSIQRHQAHLLKIILPCNSRLSGSFYSSVVSRQTRARIIFALARSDSHCTITDISSHQHILTSQDVIPLEAVTYHGKQLCLSIFCGFSELYCVFR